MKPPPIPARFLKPALPLTVTLIELTSRQATVLVDLLVIGLAAILFIAGLIAGIL
jgi:hypothetical protein